MSKGSPPEGEADEVQTPAVAPVASEPAAVLDDIDREFMAAELSWLQLA